jgi:hypothetical protein
VELEPAARLRGTVVMEVMRTVMTMMMARRGKSRRCDQHQQKGSEHELFHGLRVAPGEVR